MKMKKFLVRYVVFVFSLIFLLMIMSVSSKGDDSWGKTNYTDDKDKGVKFTITEELKPKARIICKIDNGVAFGEWIGVEEALLERIKMRWRFRIYEVYVQYDKWPD